MTGDDSGETTPPDPVIEDDRGDSVAIRVGRMKTYIFYTDDDNLRYNGCVNAPERTLSELPAPVVSKAESHTDLELQGYTQEHVERLEEQSVDPWGDE